MLNSIYGFYLSGLLHGKQARGLETSKLNFYLDKPGLNQDELTSSLSHSKVEETA